MPSGKETVLHSFAGSGDGKYPDAGLITVKGTLYGTTSDGGGSGCYNGTGCGTVFSITSSGTETVLHSFPYGDGSQPEAGLINVKGTLYGTTHNGGANNVGTVFSITTSGTETVLYSFKGGTGDGDYPAAALLNVKGTLYGTTYAGGTSGNCSGGCGTVFKITTSGTETVLHSFAGGKHGIYPDAGLINVNGTLYGTTSFGGASGDGTVFSITPSGKETVLHSFGASAGDGTNPYAGLINVKGTLYGTTVDGGANDAGTVFKITPSGKETVLYSFGLGSGDGNEPEAGLLNVSGTLYGTTFEGGANNDGTVFSLSP
jgi:uncharacterized repeat protein (TIGR03803 family)